MCILFPSFSYQSADIRGAARRHGLSVLYVRPPFACVPSFFSLWFVREGKIARGTVKTDVFPPTKLIGWSSLYNTQLWHLSVALLAEDVKKTAAGFTTSFFRSTQTSLAVLSEIELINLNLNIYFFLLVCYVHALFSDIQRMGLEIKKRGTYLY